jgi:ADP-ribose pyrophosphatase YjhB (NUDIX family)
MILPIVDLSWYKRPKGIRTRISSGGIVVRLTDTGPLIALTREGDWPHYVLPKGGVEEGETYEESARREIEEEAGLSKLTLIHYLGRRDRLNFARTRWMSIHYYLFTTTQETGIPTDSAHHFGVWWFPPNDLPLMLWPEQISLIQEQIPAIQQLTNQQP